MSRPHPSLLRALSWLPVPVGLTVSQLERRALQHASSPICPGGDSVARLPVACVVKDAPTSVLSERSSQLLHLKMFPV